MPGAVSAEAARATEERGLDRVSHRALRFGARSTLWLGLAVGAACGCAARAPSSPFIIRQGHGPIEIEGPAVKMVTREAVARAEREAIAERAKQAPRASPSIEQKDPGLRRALSSLQKEPSSSAHVNVAVAYHRLRVLDAAFDQFSQAIALDPRNAAAWDGRARLWRDWGMIAPALSDAHRARFLAPRRAEISNTLGTILERAGQCDGARRAYRDAIGLDHRAAWARQNLARLETVGADCGLRALKPSRRSAR
jgi:tetratricopeptide (TPR) repeat protein